MTAAVLPGLPKIVITNFAKIGKASIARTPLHLLNYFSYRIGHQFDDIIIDINRQVLLMLGALYLLLPAN